MKVSIVPRIFIVTRKNKKIGFLPVETTIPVSKHIEGASDGTCNLTTDQHRLAVITCAFIFSILAVSLFTSPVFAHIDEFFDPSGEVFIITPDSSPGDRNFINRDYPCLNRRLVEVAHSPENAETVSIKLITYWIDRLWMDQFKLGAEGIPLVKESAEAILLTTRHVDINKIPTDSILRLLQLISTDSHERSVFMKRWRESGAE